MSDDVDEFEEAGEALADEPDAAGQEAAKAIETPDVVDPLDFDDEEGRSDFDTVPAEPKPPRLTSERASVLGKLERISQAERTVRVAQIVQMRLQGFKRGDVYRYVNAKLIGDKPGQWHSPMSERSLSRLIAAADKLIAEEATHDRAFETGKAIARLEALYRKSYAAGLLGTALRVQSRINKMLGLDAPVKVAHGNDPDNPLPIPVGTAAFTVLIQEVRE
jgi:hypothetical protein